MRLGIYTIGVENREVKKLRLNEEDTSVLKPTTNFVGSQQMFNSIHDLSGLLGVEESNQEVCFMFYVEDEKLKIQPLWSVDAMTNLYEVHKLVSENNLSVKDAIGFLSL